MDSIQLHQNFSRNVLTRMLVFTLLAVALVVWKLDFINNVYLRDQLTPTGLLINSAIVGLFLLGLLRLIAILLHYKREEAALQQVLVNLREGMNPVHEIDRERIISRRYRSMKALHQAHTPINHNAMAATLLASESTQTSFPRFVNNMLILGGVFGTIVSLSIALLGASDLLESAVSVDGMGLVVHGMSTALSTTITAIACYVFFGYFLIKVTDVQTNVLSGVEQITGNALMPRFQVQNETLLHQFAGLIRSLQSLIGQMKKSQDSYAGLAQEMRGSQQAFEDLETRLISALVEVYRSKFQPINSELDDIKSLLRLGFRLPEDP